MSISRVRAVFLTVLSAGVGLGSLGCSREDSSGGSIDEWCALNDEQLGAEIIVELSRLFGLDESAAAAGAARLAEILDQARDAAPDEIADDVDVVTAGGDTMIAAFSGAQYRLLDVEIDGFRSEVSGGRGVDANDAIDEFTRDACNSGSFLEVVELGGLFANVPAGSTFGSLLVNSLGEVGFAEAEIACFLDSSDAMGAVTDSTFTHPLFTDCGVSEDRLADLRERTSLGRPIEGFFDDE